MSLANHMFERSGETGKPTPSRAKGLGRRIVGGLTALVTILLFAAALVFLGGFLWFVRTVPTEEVALKRDADGIVVLTGGSSRITDAVELLAAGHGKRLLITGVHRTTSSREIARVVPSHERLVNCCVDLDHSAVNTVGNAAETKRWVKDLQFRSLIVVTSSYHMPRTMAELGQQLPDVALIPFPVVTDKLRSAPWWDSLPTAKLLFSEYLKYMVAHIRMRFAPGDDMTEVARARGKAKG